MDENHQYMVESIREKVREAKKELLSQQRNPDDFGEKCILEKLLLAAGKDSDIPELMAVDGIAAGIDTTAVTMGFFMYNLAVNPEKQEILFQEIQRVRAHLHKAAKMLT